MGIEALAAGAIAASAVSGVAGAAITSHSNKQINDDNMMMQNLTNQQNLSLMREAWSRDDYAVRRRAADLEAAGLSKTLAAGSAAASSSPIKLEAPQKQFEDNHWAQSLSSLGQAIGQAPLNYMRMESAAAQTNLMKEQINSEKAKQQLNSAQAVNNLANAGFKSQATRIAKKDAELWTRFGVDVRDKDAVSKTMKQFPQATSDLREMVTHPGKVINKVKPITEGASSLIGGSDW